jgi:hypothetical protein
VNNGLGNGLREIGKWALIAALLTVVVWFGGYMTARHYTKRMVRDSAMLAEMMRHNG